MQHFIEKRFLYFNLTKNGNSTLFSRLNVRIFVIANILQAYLYPQYSRPRSWGTPINQTTHKSHNRGSGLIAFAYFCYLMQNITEREINQFLVTVLSNMFAYFIDFAVKRFFCFFFVVYFDKFITKLTQTDL